MAVSGTTTFTMNRDEVITDALLEIGAVALGATPKTAQITHAARRLNAVLKAWQGERVFLYAKATGTLATTASQSYITIAAGRRRILSAWIQVSGTDSPLTKISMEEYDQISNKSGEGLPLYYMVDESASKMYLYPVPDSGSYNIYYRYEAVLDDMTSATDDFDLPQPALDMLVKCLANELTTPYGTPDDRAARVSQRAEVAFKKYMAHYNQEFNPTDIKVPRGSLIV